MTDDLLGLAIACLASVFYYGGLALQAVEAREVPEEHGLHLSLLQRLLRRPRWLVGTALTLIGFPLQAIALTLAPLTLVQPALAVGLLLLLAIGSRMLGEAVGRREVMAVGLIALGVLGLVSSAPTQSDEHAGAVPVALVLLTVGAGALAPYVLLWRRRLPGLSVAMSAGFAYAWGGLATKLVATEWAAARWWFVAAWVAATAGAALIAILSESTALQKRPATQVGPIVLVVDILVAVLAAPLLTKEDWATTPFAGGGLVLAALTVVAGAAVLASSRPVARLVGAGSARD